MKRSPPVLLTAYIEQACCAAYLSACVCACVLACMRALPVLRQAPVADLYEGGSRGQAGLNLTEVASLQIPAWQTTGRTQHKDTPASTHLGIDDTSCKRIAGVSCDVFC